MYKMDLTGTGARTSTMGGLEKTLTAMVKIEFLVEPKTSP